MRYERNVLSFGQEFCTNNITHERGDLLETSHPFTFMTYAFGVFLR